MSGESWKTMSDDKKKEITEQIYKIIPPKGMIIIKKESMKFIKAMEKINSKNIKFITEEDN
jgi:hypothetical protein